MLSYSFSVLCLTMARYLFTENFEGFCLSGWGDWGWQDGCAFLLNQKGFICLPAAGMRDS